MLAVQAGLAVQDCDGKLVESTGQVSNLFARKKEWDIPSLKAPLRKTSNTI